MNSRLFRSCVPLVILLLAGFAAVDAQAPPVSAPADIARGQHLATALAGCADCHGANFAGGRAFARGGSVVYAANLTAGAGGIADHSDADVRRAIRAGVAPDGRPLRVMPWREYAVMTDADVDALIAYLRSLPPVANVVPPSVAAAAAPGMIPATLSSATIEKNAAETADAPGALTGGAYLARIGGCTGCHGANLAGGPTPGGAAAPNISHAGIGTWTFADFTTAMRTGKTPSGRILAAAMPWKTIGQMTDAELRSVYDFLESTRDSGR